MENGRPPPYQTLYPEASGAPKKSKASPSQKQWSLKDQVDDSRHRHVSVVAEKIHAVLERRAMCGISQTRLVLVPSGQRCGKKAVSCSSETIMSDHCADVSREHVVVEYADTEKPVVVELTGEADTVEFWSQPLAIEDVQRQVSVKAGGRGGGMATVSARLDEVHIRSASVFGLLETEVAKVVVVEVQ